MKTYITIINEDGAEEMVKTKVEVVDETRITKKVVVDSFKDGFAELKTDLGRATKILWNGYTVYWEAYYNAYVAAFNTIKEGFKETSDMIADTYL